MLKRIFKYSAYTLLLVIIAAVLYIFRPWADHQGWRLFHKSNPFIDRVHTHANWHLLSPYAELKASNSPRQYKRELTALTDIHYEFEGKTYTAVDYYKKANLVGLMVLHGDKVVVENYAQGVEADTTYHIMSSTKSFTSTMVGIALKDGKIASLDDKVETYAKQYKDTEYGKTSIKHLLMMSSGIGFFHPGNLTPNRRDVYFDLWINRASFDEITAGFARDKAAGTEFKYTATDTHVLSRVVEGAYNTPYIDLVQKKLWTPGGFASDAQWSIDSDGNPFGQMALSVTLQDYAHFGQLQLEDLVLNGQKVVKDDWFDMVENAQAPFQEPYITEDGRWRDGYSFQWWLPYGYDQEFIARGAGDQYMYVNKKHNYVVAQFSGGGKANTKEQIAFYRAVGKHFKAQQ